MEMLGKYMYNKSTPLKLRKNAYLIQSGHDAIFNETTCELTYIRVPRINTCETVYMSITENTHTGVDIKTINPRIITFDNCFIDNAFATYISNLLEDKNEVIAINLYRSSFANTTFADSFDNRHCNVTQLNLCDMGLLIDLGEILPQSRVTHLTVSASFTYTVYWRSFLHMLSKNGVIQYLKLENFFLCNLLELIEAMKGRNSITQLLIWHYSPTIDYQLKDLAEYIKSPECSLTELHLQTTDYETKSMNYIVDALPSPSCKIQKLHLHDVPHSLEFTTCLIRCINQLKEAKKSMEFLHTRIHSNAFNMELATSLVGCTIRSLELPGHWLNTRIAQIALADALTAPSPSSLKHLVVDSFDLYSTIFIRAMNHPHFQLCFFGNEWHNPNWLIKEMKRVIARKNLLTLLEAKQFSRLGTKSRMRKLPKDLIRYLGNSLDYKATDTSEREVDEFVQTDAETDDEDNEDD